MPDNIRENIEVRSEEVHEIMSRAPKWMIRWGISLIFILICCFVFLTWLIRYPDVVKGTVTLTTVDPPIKLIVKNSGEIDKINFEDNSLINKGDSIISLKNNLSKEAKIFLENICAEIKDRIRVEDLENYIMKQTPFVFGAIQNDYLSLEKAISEYQYLLHVDNTEFEISNLKEQVHNHFELSLITKKQISLAHEQLGHAKEKYDSDKLLFKNGVISKLQFYEEQKKLDEVKIYVDNLEKSLIQNSIKLTDLSKQLNEIENNYSKRKIEILKSIETSLLNIENELSAWELNFQINSPIKGKLTYLENLHQNQFVQKGKELFAIIPENQEYIGLVKIPQTGYGKVKLGQKVRIKLDNYPYQEFGQILGRVIDVSLIPNEQNYLVKVELVRGLISSYNKRLLYTPEMVGTAEIITEDLRLIDRIFNKFRKIFD